MTLIARPADTGDAALVERLFRESFTDTFGHLYAPEDLAAFLADCSVEDWKEELADPAMEVLIAYEGEEPAGFIRVGPGTVPKKHPANALELRQLYLLPAWKGRGLARPLVEWAISRARERGAAHLYLTVYIDNLRARRLYERFGFVEEGPYAFMVGNHEDQDIVMRLAL